MGKGISYADAWYWRRKEDLKPELVYWWNQQHLRSEDMHALKEGEMHAALEVPSPSPACEINLWEDKLEAVWMCLLGKYF